ncbi:MAG: hypothetical protein Q6J33_07200 [Gloeomargarita sp. DG_2_bins_126]
MLKRLLGSALLALLCMQFPVQAEITRDLVEKHRRMFERIFVSTVIRDATTNCRAAGHPVFENLVVNDTLLHFNLYKSLDDNRFENEYKQNYILYNLKTDPLFPEPLTVTDKSMCSFYMMVKRYVNGENVRVYRWIDKSIPEESLPFFIWEGEKVYQKSETRPMKDMLLTFYVINGIQEKYQAADGSWVYPYYVSDYWDYPIQLRRLLMKPKEERPKIEHYTITLEEFFAQLALNNENSQVQVWETIYDEAENMAFSTAAKDFMKMPEYENERQLMELFRELPDKIKEILK